MGGCGSYCVGGVGAALFVRGKPVCIRCPLFVIIFYDE